MVLVLEEVKQTRDALRYGYAVGKVRVLETRALDRSALERLLDARTFPEQKRLLSETAYARSLETAETPQEVERALDDALDSFYRFLEEAALPEPVVRFFRLRYDYANLKATLKGRLMGASIDGLLVDHGTVPAGSYHESLADLPGTLGQVAVELSELTDPTAVDAEVDHAYFAELHAAARETRSHFLLVLAELMVDIANLKTLVRGRLAGHGTEFFAGLFIEGGSVASSAFADLAELEVREIAPALKRFTTLRSLANADLSDPKQLDPLAEGLTAAALRRGRRDAAGPEPVIAYVMGREAEVRILRVLLLGTLTGIGFETLRTRLSAAIG